MLGGQRVGLITVLVLSGVSSRADIAKIYTAPDIVFANMVELAAAWRARRI